MVLLDLIGADNPVFFNTFKETDDLFQRMQLIGMYFFDKFTYCTVHISLHVIASHVVFIFGEKIDCISVVLWVHFGAYMYNLMHVNQCQPHRQPFSHATHYISILSLTTAVYYLANKKWKKLLTVILCSIFFLLERRLMSSEQLFSEHSRPYFNPGLLDRAYMVEDDHIPFLQRGE